ncbi:MAG: TolC family protein [Duncaniella sp.]|nr:TolC family protein [Duncaniella sp.]
MKSLGKFSRLFPAVLLAVAIGATEAEASVWSLDSCINYALIHNLDVKGALIEQCRGAQSVTEAKDRFLPTISAGASQGWSYGRGLTSQNTYANRNTSSTGWNASLQLPIFQGLNALRQLQHARASERNLDLRLQNVRDEVTLSVISFYFQALYSREMLAVRREELRLARVQLERQEILLEGGKVPEVDVLQARSQVASSEVAVVSAEGDLDMAMLELKRALELDDNTPLELASVETTALPLLPSAEEVYARALQSNSSILVSRSGLEVADRAVSTAKTGYLPRLSFNASLGSSYYTMSGVVSDPFSRQMRNNLSKSLGFSLSVPIFDAFSTRNQVRQARLQRLSAELEVERSETNLLRTIRQTHTEARNALARYNSSLTAVEAARAALDAMTDKYTYGKANATEWEQARSTYTNALAEQVGVTYQYLLKARTLEFYNR